MNKNINLYFSCIATILVLAFLAGVIEGSTDLFFGGSVLLGMISILYFLKEILIRLDKNKSQDP